MPARRDPPHADDWSWEATRRRQVLRGLELTPAQRLRWLEETVAELHPWVGRARHARPVEPSPHREP